ncbi:hypothetical protein [Deinococcus aetherius]|uniref:hypothetical protein n=1 Tax=Deinococcus aetherius TaxID=200252 RepID=UPI00223087F3|nr:hypothetical protein [Deinococcus aetherius]
MITSRHVHSHVVPRYSAARSSASLRFEDPDYPAHYAGPSAVRHLDENMGRR